MNRFGLTIITCLGLVTATSCKSMKAGNSAALDDNSAAASGSQNRTPITITACVGASTSLLAEKKQLVQTMSSLLNQVFSETGRTYPSSRLSLWLPTHGWGFLSGAISKAAVDFDSAMHQALATNGIPLDSGLSTLPDRPTLIQATGDCPAPLQPFPNNALELKLQITAVADGSVIWQSQDLNVDQDFLADQGKTIKTSAVAAINAYDQASVNGATDAAGKPQP